MRTLYNRKPCCNYSLLIDVQKNSFHLLFLNDVVIIVGMKNEVMASFCCNSNNSVVETIKMKDEKNSYFFYYRSCLWIRSLPCICSTGVQTKLIWVKRSIIVIKMVEIFSWSNIRCPFLPLRTARVATKNENRTRLNEPLRNGKNGRIIFDHEKISTMFII